MSEHAIATIASHTALQILKGARDEGFRTIAICKPGQDKVYKSFNSADEYVFVDDFKDFFSVEEELLKRNAILIPHGSFVAYIGAKKVQSLRVKHYGNKNILKWESDRLMERQWLTSAGIRMPKDFSSASEIDRMVIVKFHGAQGGQDYFLAKDEADFNSKISGFAGKKYSIQEYIVGVPIYIHYFYSPLTKELEVMSFDRRYESNVDAIGRIHADKQAGVDVTYTVTGNTPLVIRESLLPEVFKMGEAVVSGAADKGGLWGPFCLETVMTPDLKFYVFEISARIVAGTNLYPNGSPYTDLKYSIPMSTGRRIARDIKQAIEEDRLDEVLG